MKTHQLFRGIVSMLLVFVITLPQPSAAQFNVFVGAAKKLAETELTKRIGEAVNVGSPLKLDQNTAFTAAAEPTNFHCTSLVVSNVQDLNRPLPPGDYCVTVVAFCSRWSIHAPGAGKPYKLALVQGPGSKAISALLIKGTAQGLSPANLQNASWEIQAGIPLNQMRPEDQALCKRLIPTDLQKEIEGDYVQKAESYYKVAQRIPGFPSLAQLGETGKLFEALLHGRQVLSDKTIAAENIPDALYERTGDGLPRVLPPEPAGPPSPWAEIRPGVIARLTIQQGNMGRNLLEFRLRPQSAQSAYRWAGGVRFVNASYMPQVAMAGNAPTLGSILGESGFLEGAAIAAGEALPPLLIGYSIGLAAQALIIMAMTGGGHQTTPTTPPITTPTSSTTTTAAKSRPCNAPPLCPPQRVPNKPNAVDPTLQSIYSELWQQQDQLPDGTVGILCIEIQANPNEQMHFRKAAERLVQITRRLSDLSQPLGSLDRITAERVQQDLRDAVRTAEEAQQACQQQ